MNYVIAAVLTAENTLSEDQKQQLKLAVRTIIEDQDLVEVGDTFIVAEEAVL